MKVGKSTPHARAALDAVATHLIDSSTARSPPTHSNGLVIRAIWTLHEHVPENLSL